VTRLGEASAFGWRARKKKRADRVRLAAQSSVHNVRTHKKHATGRRLYCTRRRFEQGKRRTRDDTVLRLLCLNENQGPMGRCLAARCARHAKSSGAETGVRLRLSCHGVILRDGKSEPSRKEPTENRRRKPIENRRRLLRGEEPD
jgi:hypothetical protein